MESPKEIEHLDLRLDLTRALAFRAGKPLALTATEFRLLATLAARPRRSLTRLELVRSSWPLGAIVHDNTLDAYVARLRRKLRALPQAPEIATVHGVGYKIR